MEGNRCGQTLIVTDGVGRAQCEGGEIVEIRADDVIWCPPGTSHWEAAAPDRAMTYVAVQEEPDGGGVPFGRTVTDEEYRDGSPVS